MRDLQFRGAPLVAYLQADLNDLEQVEDLSLQAIAQLQSWQSVKDDGIPILDVLINNAGVFDPEERYSAQGYDATMAINVLAPFVLTCRLLPALINGADARIITTSSISQSRTLPDIDALFAKKDENGNFDVDPLPYSGHSFYSYSKLGDLLFTLQLAKIASKYKIQCLTMDPGTINTKMLLAGWGPCGIPVKKANNTYKLATGEGYSFGHMNSGSYHFGGMPSNDSNDKKKLDAFWKKLSDCTGVTYYNL